MTRRSLGQVMPRSLMLAGCFLAGMCFLIPAAYGQAKGSASKVKISATAAKPDSNGKQVVTIHLEIEKGWHAYANPIGAKDFPGEPTLVTIAAKEKLQNVTIDYPRGKLVLDKDSGDHFVYEGKNTIKATVQRTSGDTSPLQVNVKIQTCNAASCLLPSTVKVTVK